jgi:hypothetical protein
MTWAERDMTGEEIVLNRMKKKAKSPLHFKEPAYENYRYYYDSREYFNRQMAKWQMAKFNECKSNLEKAITVHDRVNEILLFSHSFPTYSNRNRLQCNQGARRSAQDIWRTYIYYFGDIDIFSIMRELYKLAIREKKFSTFRCCTVRKQVFWYERNPSCFEVYNKADLGVPLKEWENIGKNFEYETA